MLNAPENPVIPVHACSYNSCSVPVIPVHIPVIPVPVPSSCVDVSFEHCMPCIHRIHGREKFIESCRNQ